MSHDRIDHLHADPNNWKWGVFYVCRADRRLIVPKRIRGFGWTLNFGRPMALPLLILVPLLLMGIIRLTVYLGASSQVLLAVKVTLLIIVLAIGMRLSKSAEALPPPDSNSSDRPDAPRP